MRGKKHHLHTTGLRFMDAWDGGSMASAVAAVAAGSSIVGTGSSAAPPGVQCFARATCTATAAIKFNRVTAAGGGEGGFFIAGS